MFNEAIIEEREQGIKEIHHQINEVNEIFKDLAVLVREQGAVIGEQFDFSENRIKGNQIGNFFYFLVLYFSYTFPCRRHWLKH